MPNPLVSPRLAPGNRPFHRLGRVVDDAQKIAVGRVGLAAALFSIAHGRGRQAEFPGESVLREAEPFADRRDIRRGGEKRAGRLRLALGDLQRFPRAFDQRLSKPAHLFRLSR